MNRPAFERKRDSTVKRILIESELQNKSRNENSRNVEESENDKQLALLRCKLSSDYILEYQKDSLNMEKFQAISQFLLEYDYISFEKFLTIREISSAKIKKYFSSKVFMYFGPNDEGIKTEHFLRYEI